MKLSIELVPASSFFTNLRSLLTKSQWNSIRKAVYKQADYKCEICGNKSKPHPVECHEKWEYDDITKTQSLVGLIALCRDCHQVKHIGFAAVSGRLDKAINHFVKINQISKEQALECIENCFYIWEIRSQSSWSLDVSWLKGFLDENK